MWIFHIMFIWVAVILLFSARFIQMEYFHPGVSVEIKNMF